MSHLDPAQKTAPSELRKFGLLVGGAMLALSALLFWRQKPTVVVGVFAAAGSLLLIAGIAIPKALGAIYTGWMRFALLLSKVTTPIFMGAIYFVLLAPIGAIMRAMGRQPLRQKKPDSVWVTRPIGARASTLERQF